MPKLRVNFKVKKYLDMPVEKTAGAVIFRREDNKIYYLLLNYAAIGRVEKTYWGFSKGHIEKGEKEIDAIIREIREETGIEDLEFLEGFKENEKYFFRHIPKQNKFVTGQEGKTIFKSVYYLLAETKTKQIKISFEHIGYEWLPYEEAVKELTFKGAKEILKKANDFLRK